MYALHVCFFFSYKIFREKTLSVQLIFNENVSSNVLFPCQFLAWNSSGLIAEFVELLPSLVAPDTAIELLHTILDLPCLAAALDLQQRYIISLCADQLFICEVIGMWISHHAVTDLRAISLQTVPYGTSRGRKWQLVWRLSASRPIEGSFSTSSDLRLALETQ